MYFTSELEVWNLTPRVPVFLGAQKYFNIVGRLKNPSQIFSFSYTLNGAPEKPIFFNNSRQAFGRLQNFGDFSIDTILIDDLKSTNKLILYLSCHQLKNKKYCINFPCYFYTENTPNFYLDLNGIDYSQQIGQIIDGKWLVGCDKSGKTYLEIKEEDAGYDRIILMGHRNWTHSYEINAKLCVTKWTQPVHNVGLLFKWNHHLIGNGTSLPSQWSTGLGYFYSQFPGLRIRFGVNVHIDTQNKKQGDYILGKGTLSFTRYLQKRIFRFFYRFIKKFIPSLSEKYSLFSEMIPGVKYNFCLRILPEEYSLTVWRENRRKPSPQVVVKDPLDRLPHGSVGIIAYNASIRVYEFEVSPVR